MECRGAQVPLGVKKMEEEEETGRIAGAAETLFRGYSAVGIGCAAAIVISGVGDSISIGGGSGIDCDCTCASAVRIADLPLDRVRERTKN